MPKIPTSYKNFKDPFSYAREIARQEGITLQEALSRMGKRSGNKRYKSPAPKITPQAKSAPMQDELPGLWKSQAYRRGLMDKLAMVMPVTRMGMAGLAAANRGSKTGVKEMLKKYLSWRMAGREAARSGVTVDEVARGLRTNPDVAKSYNERINRMAEHLTHD